MTRLTAATTHLIISSALASLVIALILFGWYPLPLFQDIGGPMLVALIVGIDVVLGPLMTLIVFNPIKPKRELIMDLTLIGLIQLGALSYGLYSGYMGRVAYGTYYQGEFKLVYAADLAPKFLAEAPPAFQQVPTFGLRYAGLIVPDTEQNRSDLAFYGAIGAGPERFPKFYVPLSAVTANLQTARIPRDTLLTNHPALTSRIDGLTQDLGLTWQDIAVLPFNLRTTTNTIVVDLKSNRVLKVFRVNPLPVKNPGS